MKIFKKNEGITLIALVITIIVMLILVGVTLSMISGENGIFGKAERAVSETDKASIKEDVELAVFGLMADYYSDHLGEYGDPMDYVKEKCKAEDGITTNAGAILKYDEVAKKFSYTNGGKVTNVEIDSEGKVKVGDFTDAPEVPDEPTPPTPVAKYTVTYDANGGSGVPTDDNEYEKDATVTVKFEPVPTKTGYTFMGWTNDASNKNTAKFTSSGTKTFEMGNANATLYAVWELALKVGDTVSYSPSGTYSEWSTAHSGYSTSYSLASGSSYTNSSTQTDMSITSWKVFKIDGNTVQLVPAAATTNSLGLEGADGYNNSVKLLNDACSSLYGNSSKGIGARSIKIEDFEDIFTELGTYSPSLYTGTAQYGKQYTSNYTINKTYPKIYAQEKRAAINTTTPATSGLGFSDSASSWVTGTEIASNYLRPVQTYYNTSSYDTTKEYLGKYADLLLPNGSTTQYWVASRCVGLGSHSCDYYVSYVGSGSLDAGSGCRSDGESSWGGPRSLFPVVSLSSELIGTNSSGGFVVK